MCSDILKHDSQDIHLCAAVFAHPPLTWPHTTAPILPPTGCMPARDVSPAPPSRLQSGKIFSANAQPTGRHRGQRRWQKAAAAESGGGSHTVAWQPSVIGIGRRSWQATWTDLCGVRRRRLLANRVHLQRPSARLHPAAQLCSESLHGTGPARRHRSFVLVDIRRSGTRGTTSVLRWRPGFDSPKAIKAKHLTQPFLACLPCQLLKLRLISFRSCGPVAPNNSKARAIGNQKDRLRSPTSSASVPSPRARRSYSTAFRCRAASDSARRFASVCAAEAQGALVSSVKPLLLTALASFFYKRPGRCTTCPVV